MNHTPLPWRFYKGWIHPNFDGPSPSATNGDTAICELLGPDAAANGALILAAVNAFSLHREAISEPPCGAAVVTPNPVVSNTQEEGSS